MTEQEWLECADLYPMLAFLERKTSDRKLRLFGCACCRRIWHLLTDARNRHGVELAERYADGEASDAELDSARTAAWAVSSRSLGGPAAAAEAAAEATWMHDEFGGSYHVSLLTYHAQFAVGETRSEIISQCGLLREVSGSPFQPVTVDPAWLTSTVTSLAQAIYADRAFDRLPILADALEDAGCDNADLLNHCRQPGEHVRGCFAVDLVLGKE